MLASSSVLSRFANRLFGKGAGRKRWRRADLRRRVNTPVYMAAEVMEERALLSAVAFDGVLNIGNGLASTYASDVATDAAGNDYVVGSFQGTVDFDETATHAGDTDIITAQGSRDIFVAKYASDNSLLWVQTMGSAGDDRGRSIEIDGSGNLYVAGYFNGTVAFGSTNLVSAGSADGFVAKLNSGGTVQWAKRWGTTGEEWGLGVGVDSSGNAYAAGISGTSNGSGGITSVSGSDILKFSSSGNAVWSESIDSNQAVADMAVDTSGNVFLAGSFQGTVDFDPSAKRAYASSGPSQAGFVLKLNTQGKFGWVSPFTGQTVGSTNGWSTAQSVTLDGSGNVIVGGVYTNTVDFNPGSGTTTLPGLPGASYITGGYVTKLNSTGGLVWARGLASDNTTGVWGLDVDLNGNVYATGDFKGTVDLDPGAGSDLRTTAGISDIFVVKLTAAGNYSWGETFGGAGLDGGRAIAIDPTGGIHLVGFYQDTVDFDPDPLNTHYLTGPAPAPAGSGAYNSFRLRLRQV